MMRDGKGQRELSSGGDSDQRESKLAESVRKVLVVACFTFFFQAVIVLSAITGWYVGTDGG